MWRLINEIVGEEVERGAKGEREMLKKVEDAVFDSGGEVAPAAARLVEVEAKRDAAREGESHSKMSLDRHLVGRVVVDKG